MSDNSQYFAIHLFQLIQLFQLLLFDTFVSAAELSHLLANVRRDLEPREMERERETHTKIHTHTSKNKLAVQLRHRSNFFFSTEINDQSS